MVECEWKPIPGYEGIYDASSTGLVRSHHRSGRNKTLLTDKDGYLFVTLSKDGKRRKSGVHRLVCLAFHGHPECSSMDASHIDGSRTNNTPANLKWCSRKQNIADKAKHGTKLMGDRHPRAKITREQAKEAWLSRDPARVVASRFKVGIHIIADIRSGRRWNSVTDDLGPQPNRWAGP